MLGLEPVLGLVREPERVSGWGPVPERGREQALGWGLVRVQALVPGSA